MNKSVRLPDAQVISRYKVGQSSVTITSDGRYIVHEPALTFEGEKIYREMLMYMYQSLMPLKDSRDPVAYIEENIWRRASLIGQTDKIKKCYRGLRYRLERDILRYGIDVSMLGLVMFYNGSIGSGSGDKSTVYKSRRSKINNFSSVVTVMNINKIMSIDVKMI